MSVLATSETLTYARGSDEFLVPNILSMSQNAALQEERQTRSREFVWNLDSGYVIDPTSATGDILGTVPWIANGFFSSESYPVPTLLCRINEVCSFLILFSKIAPVFNRNYK